MTDTPVTEPAPHGVEKFKTLIGDLARPFAIIATSFGATWATITVSYRVETGTDGAILMGAVFAGVGALYIGKSVEVFKTHRATSDVEIARAAGPTGETK
jgi:hypothetical protein